MRLLVCTQAVDKEDRALGFFHRWLEEMAHAFTRVEAICLKEGWHSLPGNIAVHSLGKPHSAEATRGAGVWCSRIKYVANFYRHAWLLRGEYDAVFVHMNQEYVLMGGLLWRLLGKRVVMWRNHKMGNRLTDIACMFANDICYTSPESYVATKPRAHKMPIGIDTMQFAPAAQPPAPESMLFLGRFDEVKKVKEFAQALVILKGRGTGFVADVVGSPTYSDSTYPAEVKALTQELERDGNVRYIAGVAHDEVPGFYSSHAIYANVTPSGSFDKTIGEACASGAIPVVANEVVRGIVPNDLMVKPDAPEDIARGLAFALALSAAERRAVVERVRRWVLDEHSLKALVGKLAGLFG